MVFVKGQRTSGFKMACVKIGY